MKINLKKAKRRPRKMLDRQNHSTKDDTKKMANIDKEECISNVLQFINHMRINGSLMRLNLQELIILDDLRYYTYSFH